MKFLLTKFLNKSISYFTLSFSLSILLFLIIFSISKTDYDLKREKKVELEDIIYLEINENIIAIKMLSSLAPNHVKKIRSMIRKGQFKNHIVYRKLDNFVVQIGNKDRVFSNKINSKFLLNKEATSYKHKKNVVCSTPHKGLFGQKDIADDFFILLEDSEFLDGESTIWGYIINGMSSLKSIPNGNEDKSGFLDNPIHVKNISVSYDVEKRFLNSDSIPLAAKNEVCS